MISTLLSLSILNIGLPCCAYAVIILVRLAMDRLNCPTVKNYYRISRERLFVFLPVNAGAKNFSVEQLAFLNSEHRILSPLPGSETVHHILIVVNVLKTWKPSTESIRMFVANNSLNWSMAAGNFSIFSPIIRV